MKINIKPLAIVSCQAALLFVTLNVQAQVNSDYKIETVNSNKANVSQVNLVKTENGYVVKGKVYNRVKNRTTPIPGHVDISVVDASGKVVNTTPVSIYRISRKSRFAKFKQGLKVSPVEGNTIRVAHHNAPLGVNATDLIHK